MLDAETKARIDSSRDILVGKVPDPKSQVEQITIALIYKFMDDMDRQSEELGGKASFFSGEFRKYRWANLLDKRLGGHERLNLYAEGLDRMNTNKNIPQLFRDIFKGVFLPYRDPETLNLFLKEINGFTYDHSERLGDAYEYLLSVLGTQGEAGQFRTPRHIIDFIVAVVDPQKQDTVLDPACGTAGFLISSFKHIVKNNENLTPDERARLMTNFRGYDIAPDMVRLSRVNLYLHGFPNPVIHEYDTLTSEERWDERCDVIMANPPFMTPKGGIRPHNRFSIKANRSEVLFVDYIAEHLNPGGRAGVIVPEGIIFQSQNAYKNLRRMLLENYLWAVVSLPAGVFNPYSGVKTSVLFLDRNLAKRTDDVLFAKVANDGFDLGAQRRPIDKNDLPEALKTLEAWKQSQKAPKEEIAQAVSRKRLLGSPDCNLSGERYRDTVLRVSGKWPMVRVKDVCEFTSGLWKGEKPPLRPVRILRNTNFTDDGTLDFEDVAEHPVEARLLPDKLLKPGDILVEKSGGGPTQPVGRVSLFRRAEGDYSFSNFTARMRVIRDDVLPEFVWHVTHALYKAGATEKLQKRTSGIRNLDFTAYKELEIPLPPLAEQERLVAEWEGYRKVIQAARQVIANYKPTIKIDPEWPMVPIVDLVANEPNSLKAGPFGSSLKKEVYVPSGYKIYGQEQVIRGDAHYGDYYISEKKYRELENCKVKAGDVLISLVGTYGKTLIVPETHEPGIINPRLLKLTLNQNRMIPEFFVFAFGQEAVMSQVHSMSYGGTMDILSLKVLKNIQLPLPSLAVQREIVAELEAERALVEANRELIARMERKLQAKLAEIWGDGKK